MNASGLINRDPTVLYDVFVRNYALVDQTVRRVLPVDKQAEMTPLIIVGVFRKFFELAPSIVSADRDIDVTTFLRRIAEDGARRYRDNSLWLEESRKRLSALESRSNPLATAVKALGAALRRYESTAPEVNVDLPRDLV
jgi:hypothetical protein